MMKKIINIAVSILLVFSLILTTSVSADALSTKQSEVIYLDNGCYITIELNIIENRASTIKRGNKAYIYRNGSGDELWRATLYGTWTYTGTSATCTASSCTTTITDTAWSESSKSASRSGASAIGECTMAYKILGITINKETIDLRITCDANGNLS